MSFRLINKYGSTKPLYESERLEWSSFGTLSNEIGRSITEFKKGRISDSDIIYFKAAVDFLSSVLEAEKEKEMRKKVCRDRLEIFANANMFVHRWANSDLAFPKNEKEYHMEKLFSFFGELALLKIHKSPLTGCHGRY